MSEPACNFKVSNLAATYLNRLDGKVRRRINDALIAASRDPIGTSDHLVNRGDERTIRIGGLRIIFRIYGEDILVDAILLRGDAYRARR